MRRPVNQEVDSAGSDSFLDIVANIVGILIILVMVVAARIHKVPKAVDGARGETEVAVVEEADEPEAPTPVIEAPEEEEPRFLADDMIAEAKNLADEAVGLEHENLKLGQEIKRVQSLLDLAEKERNQLAVWAQEAKTETENMKSSLDAQAQQRLAAQQEMQAAQEEIARLQSAIAAVAQRKPDAVQLTHYPTPISETVYGREVHFQLRGGRVAYVPIKELVDRLKNQTDLAGIIGPSHDFSMRYRLTRVVVPGSGGRAMSGIALERFEMVPSRAVMGEALEVALQPNSKLLREIILLEPESTTVTLWTYPDSFDEMRKLRDYLNQRGYRVAARPLPHGTPIQGSPSGSRSSAQ